MLIQPMPEPLSRGDGASFAPGRQALVTLRDGLRRLLALEVGPATVAALLGTRPGEARAWLAGLGLGTPVLVTRLLAHLPPLEAEEERSAADERDLLQAVRLRSASELRRRQAAS
jgi:hypothetical protein